MVYGKMLGGFLQKYGSGEAKLAVNGGEGGVGFVVLEKDVPGQEGLGLCQKRFVIGSQHGQVHVVVPGDEALIFHSAQCTAAYQEVGKVQLLADLQKGLEQLQNPLL